MKETKFELGLYRHFKGDYYFATSVSKDCNNPTIEYVHYFNVLHPEKGTFIRVLTDFIAEYDSKTDCLIKDRGDNITGQTHRLEKVHNLDGDLCKISTQALIDELERRKVEKPIYSPDYAIGKVVDYGDEVCIYPREIFTDEKEAKTFFKNNVIAPKGTLKLFKREYTEIKVN